MKRRSLFRLLALAPVAGLSAACPPGPTHPPPARADINAWFKKADAWARDLFPPRPQGKVHIHNVYTTTELRGGDPDAVMCALITPIEKLARRPGAAAI